MIENKTALFSEHRVEVADHEGDAERGVETKRGDQVGSG